MREGVVVCPSRGRPHRLAYFEWGEARAPIVVYVHGLTGSGRDFDELAEALAGAGYRVLCPDLVGRGSSQRLGDPSAYRLGQYVADLEQLLSALDLGDIDWIGSSLGGLVGMTLAARPAARVRRLLLNDVGPWVPAAGFARIGEHVGKDPWLEDLESDFLLEETTREMARRGPGARVVEVEGCGHAPPLRDPTQFRPIIDWLGAPEIY